jgi:hypothetical protein
LVGETIGRTEGPDEVTLADIRRKVEVIGLDCPLHLDETCAHRTVVSPVSMTRIWWWQPPHAPASRVPGDPLRTLLPSADPPGHGHTMIVAHIVTEHHATVYPEPVSGFGRVRGIRHHEDVARGDRLDPLRLPIMLERLAMEAAANRDFSPWHFGVHIARMLGAPAAFANTTLNETLLEVAARCWGQLGARIRKLEFGMKGHNCAGDVVTLGGAVGDRHTHEGEHRVTLELWIDCPRGRSVTGSPVVALPTRDQP